MMDDAEYDWEEVPPPVRVAIDPNVRLRNNETYAGLEDATEPVAVGDEVRVWVPDTDITGNARVTEVDEARGLVYLAVDWPSLRSEADRVAEIEAHRDDDDWVIEDSGRVVKPRRLGSVYSVRFKPEDIDIVRAAADAAGVSTSELIRHAALVHARRQLAPVPAHSCGGVGCRWCDPRETASLVVSGPVLTVAGSASY